MTLDWCIAEIKVLKRELSDLRTYIVGNGLANKVYDLTQQIVQLREENARLKRGEFSSEELQNLCHNLTEDDYKAFCDGCDGYQRKLFGKCRTDHLKKVASELDGTLEELFNA